MLSQFAGRGDGGRGHLRQPGAKRCGSASDSPDPRQPSNGAYSRRRRLPVPSMVLGTTQRLLGAANAAGTPLGETDGCWVQKATQDQTALGGGFC